MTEHYRREDLTPAQCDELQKLMDKLRQLSGTLSFHRQAADRARVGRDFFIVAAWRKGVPVGRIAKAAGVHYTRVRQLIESSEEVRQEFGGDYGDPPAALVDLYGDDDENGDGDYNDEVHENR